MAHERDIAIDGVLLTKRDVFDALKKRVRAGDEDVIHFLLQQTRNIICYQLKTTTGGQNNG